MRGASSKHVPRFLDLKAFTKKLLKTSRPLQYTDEPPNIGENGQTMPLKPKIKAKELLMVN